MFGHIVKGEMIADAAKESGDHIAGLRVLAKPVAGDSVKAAALRDVASRQRAAFARCGPVCPGLIPGVSKTVMTNGSPGLAVQPFSPYAAPKPSTTMRVSDQTL